MMIMLLLITRQLVIVLIAAFVLLVRSLNAWFFCGSQSSFGFGVAFFFAAGVAAAFGVGVVCNDATNRGS